MIARLKTLLGSSPFLVPDEFPQLRPTIGTVPLPHETQRHSKGPEILLREAALSLRSLPFSGGAHSANLPKSSSSGGGG
jgi:hypothetical protein